MTIGSERAVVFSSLIPVLFSLLVTARAVMITLLTCNSGQGSSGYHSLHGAECQQHQQKQQDI